MTGKTNVDRQTNIWIDINVKVKVTIANFMQMFNMSLMNLEGIKICQQILQVNLISTCMHYIRCTVSEHRKHSS